MNLLVRFFVEYLGIKWEQKDYSDQLQWVKEKTKFITEGKVLANLPYLKSGNMVQ